jgi:hypothetical protein
MPADFILSGKRKENTGIKKQTAPAGVVCSVSVRL